MGGYMAAYASTIHCREETTCNIICKSNACWYATINCYGSRNDCNVQCDDDNNQLCPTINYITSADMELPTQVYDDEVIADLDSFPIISDLQADSSDIVCDESSTSSSCFDAMITAPENGNIQCNGLQSCAQSQLTAQGYKYIQCLGDEACSGAVSLTAYRILCFGPKSCVDVEQFAIGSALECQGLLACSEIDLIDSDMSNGMVHCNG